MGGVNVQTFLGVRLPKTYNPFNEDGKMKEGVATVEYDDGTYDASAKKMFGFRSITAPLDTDEDCVYRINGCIYLNEILSTGEYFLHVNRNSDSGCNGINDIDPMITKLTNLQQFCDECTKIGFSTTIDDLVLATFSRDSY